MLGELGGVTLRTKLVGSMLFAANVPIILAGALYFSESSLALNEQAMHQLISVREIKKNQIEDLFETTGKQVVDLSSNLMVITATNIFIDKSKEILDDLMMEPEEIVQFRDELKTYYSTSLMTEIGGGSTLKVEDLVPKSDFGVLSQYYYLKSNNNSYNEKGLMNAGEDSSIYSSMHEQYHLPIREFTERFGFDDIAILDLEGEIVYTVRKRVELGTNIKTGPWKNTHFAKAATKALAENKSDFVHYEDFDRYAPAGNEPVSFVATPIVDVFGNHLGAVVVSVSVDAINRIMGERSGLGDTGETLVFGPDELLRSDLLGIEGESLLSVKVPVEIAKNALQGEQGAVESQDINGVSILTAYAPLSLGSINWGLVAKIDSDEALGVINELMKLMFIISGIVFVGALGLAWIVGKSVLSQLGGDPTGIVKVAKGIAEGDLRKDSEMEDMGGAIGELSTMRIRLTEIMHSIKGAANEVEQGVHVLDQGNKMVVEQSEQQLSSLEKTSANMEQVTSTVKKNADSTNEARKLVSETRRQADEGAKVLGDAVVAMSNIQSSSQEIAAITGVIDEIAFQTNLLALNAAVEAARAGDHGRGFAVVATEVRNLAGRSAEAAKQIKTLIDDSTNKVKDGTELVNKSGSMLEDINNSILCVNNLIDSISTASDEQYKGIQEVNGSIVDIEMVTKKNAGLMKQLTDNGYEIGQQANNLNDMVSYFQIEPDVK